VFHQAPFVYDQTVDLGTTANALDKFLFQTHRGFCEQYAAAFAELARSVGLPTRVAVGYQRGTLEADGLWHVAEKDAHAWPEVWLGPKVGWYRFEPTPGRIDPITGKGGATGSTGAASSTTTTPTTAKSSTPTSVASPTKPLPSQLNVPPPAAPKSSSRTRVHAITAAAIAVAIVVALLLAFLLTVGIAAWGRTRRRRNDPDERRRVLGAWTEALERLAAAGIERRPSTTSLEFALRQAPALGAGDAGPPLMDLARLHTAAMYAPSPPTTAEADEAWAEFDAIEAALKVSVPRTTRWRARWRTGLRRRKTRRQPEPALSVEQ